MNDFVLMRTSQIQDLLLRESLTLGDWVVDCTLGNGQDALKLLNIVGPQGKLFGFDVQSVAIENSQKTLEASGFNNFELIEDSHANLSQYIQVGMVRGFVFNLGFLPKSDKRIKTVWPSTRQAVEAACTCLSPGGFVAITAYPGHEEGAEEANQLEVWLEALDQRYYQVSKMAMVNQVNAPPLLFWISRR